MIKYSAYWPVEGNIKPSARRYNHIEELKKKNIDVFFGDREYDLDCKQIILEDIPGQKIMRRLPRDCVNKHGYKFSSSTYSRLCGIWFSKILLLKRLKAMYPDEDYFMWVDCINAFNMEKIEALKSNKVVLNKYVGKRLGRLKTLTRKHKDFNKLDTYMHACVIKCPAEFIESFVDDFILEVKALDKSKLIYDEEVVLAFLYVKRPELFELITDEPPYRKPSKR